MKICLSFFLLFPVCLLCQPSLSQEEWKADLQYLQQKMEERHANLYHDISKNDFEKGIQDLAKLAGNIEDAELIIRLSELIAKVKDAHTWLNIGDQTRWGFKRLPIKVDVFEDGLFITGADTSFQDVIGSQILSINSHPIEEVIPKIKRIGYNENEFTQLISLTRFIVFPDVLKRFGFAEHIDTVQITLKIGEDVSNTVLSAVGQDEIGWVDFVDTQKNLPLVYKHTDRIFWTEYVAKDSLFYIQLNQCTEGDNYSLEALAQKTLELVDAYKPQKLVLDMRRNVGGNSKLMYPLIYALMHYEHKVEGGQIFVIIGRWTLSASIVFCDEIEKFCSPVFMGEPTGAKPNLFGENSHRIILPQSALSISYASAWFQAAGPFVHSPWIAPDRYIPLYSRHYFDLEQPIIDAINAYDGAEKKLSETLYQLAMTDDMDRAIRTYRNFKQDIINTYVDTRHILRRLANRLGEQNKYAHGLRLHHLNVRDYPESAHCLVNLAQYYEAHGHSEAARKYYQKTLSALPSDDQLNEYLRHYLADFLADKL